MFKPSRSQAKAKATLHNRAEKNPLIGSLESLSIRKLEKLSGIKDLSPWVDSPGFMEWFLNPESNKELLESGVELAISRALDILDTPLGDVKASDHLAAMKLILDYAGYTPKKQAVVEYKDKDIANMDEDNLDQIIKKGLAAQDKIKKDLELAVGK